MNYKELYEQAWNSWALYWKDGGIDALFAIETKVINNMEFWMTNHVYVRKQLLVHKVVGNTEEGMWRVALNDLLTAGAAKIYEGIVSLEREKYEKEEEGRPKAKYLYPLTFYDCKKK